MTITISAYITSYKMAMKACVADVDGKILKFVNVPIPKQNENEVLIRIFATAINRADLMQKRGLYNPPVGVTEVLGLECAGEVVAKGGSVNQWNLGDRVMALLAGGGYAEYVVVSQDHILLIPKELTFVEAATIPEAWLTAFQLLILIGQTKPKDTILVHAAASGVGTALIQLARLNDIRCFATAGSTEKVEFCLKLGADKAFNYKESTFAPEILEATNGKGVDVLLDCVGGNFFKENSEVIKMDGRWVFFGALGGTKVDGDVLQVILRKRVSMIGSTLRNRSDEYKKELVAWFSEDALPHFSTKKLKPILNKVFFLDEINAAHDYVGHNKNIGKVVIMIHKV